MKEKKKTTTKKKNNNRGFGGGWGRGRGVRLLERTHTHTPLNEAKCFILFILLHHFTTTHTRAQLIEEYHCQWPSYIKLFENFMAIHVKKKKIKKNFP